MNDSEVTLLPYSEKRIINPDDWDTSVPENDDTYRRWERHIRSYHRFFSMWSRECARCDDEIRSGEPYIGRIYAEALPTPVRNRKGRLIYSRVWVEYEHWMCPRDMDDADAFHRRMEQREKEERAREQRKAA